MATFYNDGTKDISDSTGWWSLSTFSGSNGLPSTTADNGIILSSITATCSGTYTTQGTLTIRAGGTFVNNGVYTGDHWIIATAASGTFINNGTCVTVFPPSPSYVTNLIGSCTNNGILSGSLRIDSNNNAGSTFSNIGSCFIMGGNIAYEYGTFSNSGVLSLKYFSTTDLESTFNIPHKGGILTNSGNITFDADSTMTYYPSSRIINMSAGRIVFGNDNIVNSAGTVVPTITGQSGTSSFGGAIIGSIF